MINFIQKFIQSKRGKLVTAVFCLMLVTILIWAVKSGRINIRAEAVYPQSISGYVIDRDGNPIGGVTITDTTSNRSSVSGSDGAYTITLPVEDVVLRYEKDGQMYNPGFSDIPSNHWAAKWIGGLKNANIISGYPDGAFHPTEEVTRAQMLVFLARALAGGDSFIPAPSGRQKFTDVPASYWAYKYIDYLTNNTTISGYPDGTFKPEDKVTRSQMAVFIDKALNLEPADKIDPSFKDVPTDHWAYQYIEKLFYFGFISGYPDGTFHPDDVVTRDQICVFIGQAFQSIPLTDGGYVPKIEHFALKTNQTIQFDVILAQSNQLGAVKGSIKNSSGKPVSEAILNITLEPVYPETYEIVTADDGTFSLYNIPAGPYPYSVFKPDGNPAQFDLNQNWENMVFIEAKQTVVLNLVIQ